MLGKWSRPDQYNLSLKIEYPASGIFSNATLQEKEVSLFYAFGSPGLHGTASKDVTCDWKKLVENFWGSAIQFSEQYCNEE